MFITALRIAGFKSFADRVDVAIEPGLTGVVGPNGCGKSNLFEALRWTMGVTSAKSLRAGGMEDVIFSGAGGRSGRTHAEVTLVIDNAERSAPALFNDADTLEVTRRITRGAGSAYSVNGADARARDVQLLFADAATGANSPALVRQGQIAELVGAKPQNRRRILEDAAGVAGLQARRHEAELKLNAAEANLERAAQALELADRDLETLRRKARQAVRYRRLSDDIRTLETLIVRMRWRDAVDERTAAEAALTQAVTACTGTQDEASRTAAIAASTAADVEPRREAERRSTEEAARAAAARDAHALEMARAEQVLVDARQRRADLEADLTRETARHEDAAAALAATQDTDAAPDAPLFDDEAIDALQSTAAAADEARERARTAARDANAALATAQARAEARARREREIVTALNALAPSPPDPTTPDPDEARATVKTAQSAVTAAERALAKARAAADDADAKHTQTRDAATKARDAAAAARAAVDRIDAEISAIDAVLGAPSNTPSALDACAPQAGYEAALAAALGEAGESGLDPDEPQAWRGAKASRQALPDGVERLSDYVTAPVALAARLSQTGLVADQSAGDAACAALKPGQRLVTREGDVWRWDGWCARGDAESPQAARLRARGRRAEAEAEHDALTTKARRAQTALTKAEAKADAAADHARAARSTLQSAEADERSCANARRDAEAALMKIDAAKEAAEQRRVEREARRVGLERERAGLITEAESEPDLATLGATAESADAEARAREDAARAAEAALVEARTAREAETRRRATLERERAQWTERLNAAAAQCAALTTRRDEAIATLNAAEAEPQRLRAEEAARETALAAALQTRDVAHDAAREADLAARAAEREARTAERAHADARAALSAGEARVETGRQAVEAARAAFHALMRREPDPETDRPEPKEGDPDAAARRLERAKGERDGLGPVDLAIDDAVTKAEEARARTEADRTELEDAIAVLRRSIGVLNGQARTRLQAAFAEIDGHFRALFTALFNGGEARLALVDSDDPLEAGLDVHACPPGKKLSSLSLMSGGEQALTATALIFAVFLARPAPICALDEVDAPLDDANVDRFCRLLDEMRRRTDTRFLIVTHNPVTMARMDRLYGVTMAEQGVSQLVSVDLSEGERMAAA